MTRSRRAGRRRLPRDRALSARLRADAVPRRRRRRAPGSRRRSAPTCCELHGRARRSSARCSPATTGAGARPASSRRCGPSACAVSSPAPATTSRTSPASAQPASRRAGAPLLVSVLFPHRARPGRAGAQPARHLPAALDSSGRRTGRSTTRRSSAARGSFDNPDFVDVVIQSYRHRYGYAPGDPALEASRPGWPPSRPSLCPTIVLHGEADGVSPLATSDDVSRFTGLCRREIVPGAGHNLPQETPDPVVRAVLELR